MGEHTLRYSPDGHEFVDVCPLCSDVALDHGWVREGHAVSPALQQHPRRSRQKTLWQALLGAREEEAGAGRLRADPAPPLRRRAGPRRGRRPLQPVDVPADGRRRGQEPRPAEGVDRAARGRQRRDRAHLRLGHHLVPVPRHARRGAAGADRRPRARPRRGRADVRAVERPLRRDRPARPRARHRRPRPRGSARIPALGGPAPPRPASRSTMATTTVMPP